MRLCSHLTCGLPADVWYHGPWCGAHAYQRWGAVIGTLSRITDAPALGFAGSAVAPRRRPLRARASASVGVPEPAIPSADELEAIYALEGSAERTEA